MSDERFKSTEQTQVDRLLSRKTPEALTVQQELFVKEYLIDLNATQAAIRAGYPPQRAAATANRMMRAGTVVANAISRAIAERSRRVGITSDRVLEHLGKVAFGDRRALFREDGSLKAPHEYDADDGAMIEGIKTRRIVEVTMEADQEGNLKQKLAPVEIQEVKLSPSLPALTAIMRHLGMFNDKLDVNVTSIAQRLRDAQNRTGHVNAVDAEFEEVDGHSQIVQEPLSPEHQALAERMLKTLENDPSITDENPDGETPSLADLLR